MQNICQVFFSFSWVRWCEFSISLRTPLASTCLTLSVRLWVVVLLLILRNPLSPRPHSPIIQNIWKKYVWFWDVLCDYFGPILYLLNNIYHVLSLSLSHLTQPTTNHKSFIFNPYCICIITHSAFFIEDFIINPNHIIIICRVVILYKSTTELVLD